MESSNQLAQKRIEATENEGLPSEEQVNACVDKLHHKNAQELKSLTTPSKQASEVMCAVSSLLNGQKNDWKKAQGCMHNPKAFTE